MMMMTPTVCISMLQFIVLLKASRGRAGLFIASSLRNMLSLSRSRSRSRSYHQQSQWCDIHNHFTLNIINKIITTCTSHREQGSRCQETWWRRVGSAIFWNWNFLNLLLTMTWPAIDCNGGDGDNCNENDHGTLRNILIISSMTMMLIMIMMIYLAATVSRTLWQLPPYCTLRTGPWMCSA